MKYLSGLALLIIALIGGAEDYPSLVNFYGTECDSVLISVEGIEPHITHYKHFNDIIYLDLVVADNCGQVKTGYMDVKGDTLNLRYNGDRIFKTFITRSDSVQIEIEVVKNEIAMCDCLFQLHYEICAIPDQAYIFMLNGHLLSRKQVSKD